MRKALISLVALFASRAHATTRVFDDFSDVSTLTFSGNATQTQTSDGWVLRLTTANPDQAGAAFGTAKISAAAFSTAFAFRMSNPDGIAPDPNGRVGADGITFAVQPVSTTLGYTGGGLGIAGVVPSVAVEFDTYMNSDFFDPSSNHIGIDLNGEVMSIATVDIDPSFNNGNIWHAWIDCDGTTLTVAVSQTDVRPDSPQLVQPVNVQQILGTAFSYLGFTAATGGGFQNQDILNWTYLDHYVAPGTDGGEIGDGGNTPVNDGGAPPMGDGGSSPVGDGAAPDKGGGGAAFDAGDGAALSDAGVADATGGTTGGSAGGCRCDASGERPSGARALGSACLLLLALLARARRARRGR